MKQTCEVELQEVLESNKDLKRTVCTVLAELSAPGPTERRLFAALKALSNIAGSL